MAWQDRIIVEPAIASVHAEFSSAAQIYLVGAVGSVEDRKNLEDRMRHLFGDEEARSMMATVEIARK